MRSYFQLGEDGFFVFVVCSGNWHRFNFLILRFRCRAEYEHQKLVGIANEPFKRKKENLRIVPKLVHET